jgi:thiol-disulfide isomerase/thioredoxin
VLLNLWTTWCTACLAEFSVLNELQRKHADDLVILGISLDGVPDEHGHILSAVKRMVMKTERSTDRA